MELIPAIALTATVVALFVGTGTGLAVSFFLQRKRKALAEQLTRMQIDNCLLYTSPSPRDGLLTRMPSSA